MDGLVARRAGRAGISTAIGLLALAAIAPPALADAGAVTIHPLADSVAGIYGVTAGPDGNIWFTESNRGKVGKMTPDGVVTDYQASIRDIRYITTGPDGNMWFTEYGDAGAIGRIGLDGSNLAEFPIPTTFNRPYALAAGPDGNIWFTEDGNKIGRITMSGQITEFTIPTRQALPDRITTGPDGAMWFTEGNVGKLGRISPQGHIKEFKLGDDVFPSGIVTGPDGNLWVTSQGGPPGSILRVDISSGKPKVTTFAVPDPRSSPFNITNGPDGNLWFTDVEAGPCCFIGRIGRITPSGEITLFAAGNTRGRLLIDITSMQDKVWYGFYIRPAAIVSMTTA